MILTLKPLHFAVLKECQTLSCSISIIISEIAYANLHANNKIQAACLSKLL